MEGLVVDEFVDLVAGSVGFGVLVGFVLVDSVGKIVGDAGVELLEAAGEDVDVVGFGHWALMSVIATVSAKAKSTANTKAKTNAGVLRFAQNDTAFEVDLKKNEQQQMQKQRQMRGFFASLRMTQLLRWI